MTPGDRPALRSVETLVVPDPRHGRVLVLRDTQGIAEGHAVLPPALVPIVARFDGRLTCADVAREVSLDADRPVEVEVVIRVAEELERGLFLRGAAFEAARARVEGEFAAATVRPASHAGGAYHSDPGKLRGYLDDACLAKATEREPPPGALVALVAPHIDPWRGAVGYGQAYAALRDGVSPDADTFVLFGTSHAPMRAPFSLCRKAFATPLGVVPADLDAIDRLAGAARGFDPFDDQLNHKREHSLEFQAVLLRHVLGERPFRIVPVLAGLGEAQGTGHDPAGDAAVVRFLDAVRALSGARPGRVVLVAGADLAHVGPRFGDNRPFDVEERQALATTDRGSLARAASVDAAGFWRDVAADLETRRVCGLGPIWSMLRSMAAPAKGHVLHYEQTVDEDDGSIVSHAAVGYYA